MFFRELCSSRALGNLSILIDSIINKVILEFDSNYIRRVFLKARAKVKRVYYSIINRE